MKLQIFPQVGLELEKLHIELFEGGYLQKR